MEGSIEGWLCSRESSAEKQNHCSKPRERSESKKGVAEDKGTKREEASGPNRTGRISDSVGAQQSAGEGLGRQQAIDQQR